MEYRRHAVGEGVGSFLISGTATAQPEPAIERIPNTFRLQEIPNTPGASSAAARIRLPQATDVAFRVQDLSNLARPSSFVARK
jgi:hypothetical protein